MCVERSLPYEIFAAIFAAAAILALSGTDALHSWSGYATAAALCSGGTGDVRGTGKRQHGCPRTAHCPQSPVGGLHCIGLEDLISIGTSGLIKAVNTFCPTKKIKLATYASRCIENEILMFLRKATQYRGEVSIDEPLNIDWDGNELLLSDILGTDADVVSRNIEQESERELLRSAVSELGTREREIMELRFGLVDGKEKTQKEVAQAIGISQSYISRLEKKIIRKLRGTLQQFNQ